MNNLPAESYADAFQLLVSVSGVLGGLAFAAVAALLSVSASAENSRTLDRPTKFTVGFAVLSAILLIVAGVTWSYMALKATQAAGAGQSVSVEIVRLHGPVSLTFISGICFLFISIAVSGFIDSRSLGVCTILAAAIGFVLSLFFLF